MDQRTHEVRAEYWRKIAETRWTISETMDGRKRHPGAKLLPLATALLTTGLCGNEGERLSSCCNRKIGAGFC